MTNGYSYEWDVQQYTGGTSQIIEGREIDSVTDEALIQAKDSETATHKPHNFLSKKTRSQIKQTIRLGEQLGKRAEFWFKQTPHPDVRQYIEDKQGIVIVWKKDTE
ncbi:MAG: restriction endonuclease fold toxin [Nostocaceae cyanobacterium]|nr:restriction endonuclease fold toxin [Nostocaceae cyanobacterium]